MNPSEALVKFLSRGRTVPQVKTRPSPQTSHVPSHLGQGLVVEELELYSDDHPTQGWIPIKQAWKDTTTSSTTTSTQTSPSSAGERGLPVVILLHSTGQGKESLSKQMAQFAHRGFFAVAIDCRYHGARSHLMHGGQSMRDVYQKALVTAWRSPPSNHQELPFLLDNVWDLMRLIDYLATIDVADSSRICVTGDSLGGMHSWLLTVADDRVFAAAPLIGVQNFGWAINNDAYHGRAGSLPVLFDAATKDLGRESLDADVVRAVWNKLLPGMLEWYDAPMSLPHIAPRRFCILSGEEDPRCPIAGILPVYNSMKVEYEKHGALSHLNWHIERRIGHQCTENMWKVALDWLSDHVVILD